MKISLIIITILCSFLWENAFSANPKEAIIYIAPDGADTNEGSFKKPLKTLEAARNLVRILKKKSNNYNFIVCLKGGKYEISKTFQLDSIDGGTYLKPIIYRAYNKEPVVISGGKYLANSGFKPATEPAILARFDEKVKDKIVQFNLKEVGFTSFGDYHTNSPHGVREQRYSPATSLFVNEKMMQIARFPNEGWLKIGNVIDRGAISKIDGFKQVLDTTNRGGTFQFDIKQAQRWTQAKDIWLSGWFYWGWFYDEVKVKQMNLENQTFELASALRYGIAAADNDEPEGYLKGEMSDKRKFFVFNLLEEIDQPGEWYIDRQSGMLYIYPTLDFERSQIVLSALDAPLVEGKNVSNVIFENITFCHGKKTGIVFENGRRNQIKGCKFKNLGGKAIVISGNNHLVQSCDVSFTKGGITASGGNRRRLISCNTKISNCNFHNYKETAVSLDGVGIMVSNNEFHHAEGAAISFAGNNHTIMYNKFDSLYTKGGDDLNIVGIGRNPSYYGSIIKFNIFSHIGSGKNNVNSVYLDDGSCGTTVFGNIFYKASTGDRGAVFTNGGSDNTFVNNIFVDNSRAYLLGNGFQTWAKERLKNYLSPDGDFMIHLTKTVNIKDSIWVKAYPNLSKYFEDDPANPKRNKFSQNVVINSEKVVDGDEKRDNLKAINDKLETDNLILKSVPKWLNWEKLKIDMSTNSAIRSQLKGFRPIPINRIGNFKDNYRTK
jgi:hypothetical protein